MTTTRSTASTGTGTEPRPAAGPTPQLTQLIGPLAVARFWSEHWERRHLLVRAAENPGLRDRCASLFSSEHVDALLSVPGPRVGDFIRLSQDGERLPREEFSRVGGDGLVEYDVEEILAQYAGGATITINRAQQCSGELATLCVDLSRELDAHVNANVYVTPAGSQGFPVHSDRHDVFLIQVEGAKHWRIQRGLEYVATQRHPNVTSDPATADWEELVLEPGDVVYIPRGLLHVGFAGSEHSMHITVGIHPFTWADVLLDALADAERDEDLLRRAVPVSSPSALEEAARAVASRVVDRLADPGALRSRATTLLQTQRAGEHRGRFRALSESVPIDATTRLRVRDGQELGVENADDAVHLTFGTKSLAFPAYVTDHVRAALGPEPVRAADLPPDLDEDGRLTLLRRLLAEGILEVC